MKYYADTGFLLSLHLQETTSAAAAALMQTVTEPLPVTPLVALEFRNALRLSVFRQTITEAQRAAAWTSFGQLNVLPSKTRCFPSVLIRDAPEIWLE